MIQIATNIEQSRKLLSLGIDPETADMVYIKGWKYPYCRMYVTSRFEPDVTDPAWSLSALINLLPGEMKDCDPDDRLSTYCLDINKCDGEWWVEYGSELRSSDPDLFAACIDLIGKLVRKGYIKSKKK